MFADYSTPFLPVSSFPYGLVPSRASQITVEILAQVYRFLHIGLVTFSLASIACIFHNLFAG